MLLEHIRNLYEIKKNVFDFLAPARGVTQAKYYPDNSPIYE